MPCREASRARPPPTLYALLLCVASAFLCPRSLLAQDAVGARLSAPATEEPAAGTASVSVLAARPLTVALDPVGTDRAGSFRSCTTDCTLVLPHGEYRLAVLTDPRPTALYTVRSEAFEIAGPGALRVRLDDRDDLRLAGVLVLVGSIVAAAALVVGAIIHGLDDPWTDPDETIGLMSTAGVVAAVGLAVGLSLAFLGDDLRVSFEPR